MVAAFRANIDAGKWGAGQFAWLLDPKELLDATIDEMCAINKQEHTGNKEKPGRSDAKRPRTEIAIA